MTKRNIPEWAKKHQTKNTQIYIINNKYYLYKIHSKWNKEKNRAQKITEEYLGRITPEKFIPKKTRQPPPTITQKEHGATNIITQLTKDIHENLQQKLPQHANTLYATAITRLINKCPLKNVQWHYETSTLSEQIPNLNLSPKQLSLFIRQFGNYRTSMVDFMQQYITPDEHIIFDGTQIISNSEKLVINQVGYNSHEDFAPQINLLYAFAVNSNTPAYYRVLNGDVCEVSAFKLSLEEMGKENLVVIADKGFGSEANFALLEKSELLYVVPLKRNSSLFNKDRLMSGDKSVFEGFFMFNGHPVWYYRCGFVFVYLDSVLKVEEERCYLCNVERGVEGFSREGFFGKQFGFGCVVLRSNVGRGAEEVYLLYKQRREIELVFDFLKNLLRQDRSYMVDGRGLESWAFINHLSLMMVYRIYDLLRRYKLLSKVSVEDFLRYLQGVRAINWSGQWHVTEVPKKTRKLLETLNLHIA